jgi:hypothetical protein
MNVTLELCLAVVQISIIIKNAECFWFRYRHFGIPILFFRVETQCGIYQRYGEIHCLYLQPWRRRQYFSPKRCFLPTDLYGAIPRKNIAICCRERNFIMELQPRAFWQLLAWDPPRDALASHCIWNIPKKFGVPYNTTSQMYKSYVNVTNTFCVCYYWLYLTVALRWTNML